MIGRQRVRGTHLTVASWVRSGIRLEFRWAWGADSLHFGSRCLFSQVKEGELPRPATTTIGYSEGASKSACTLTYM